MWLDYTPPIRGKATKAQVNLQHSNQPGTEGSLVGKNLIRILRKWVVIDNLLLMELDTFLPHFSNKQVTFRFQKQELRVTLSQSLFSSFDIDVGTRLLLKTIAKEIDLSAVETVLDQGCGVGTLGLAVAKAAPHVSLTAQDRDALAVAFTQLNARQNKVRGVTAVGGLAFENLPRTFDLILANLPGKAGGPVLQHWLGMMAVKMNPRGTTAVVVVNPLADFVTTVLQQQGSEITYSESSKGHTVFHFSGGQPWVDVDDPLRPYTRGQFPFRLGQHSLALRTVYNLPEFDTLGHYTTLALNTLKQEVFSGHILAWNPGQGHIPLFLQQTAQNRLAHLTLAGRDALSLQISQANLLAYGADPAAISLRHLPHFLALDGRYDWIILFPDVDPGVPWDQHLLPALQQRLAENGRCLLTTKSSYAFRLLNSPHTLRLIKDRKKQGYRALQLQNTL